MPLHACSAVSTNDGGSLSCLRRVGLGLSSSLLGGGLGCGSLLRGCLLRRSLSRLSRSVTLSTHTIEVGRLTVFLAAAFGFAADLATAALGAGLEATGDEAFFAAGLASLTGPEAPGCIVTSIVAQLLTGRLTLWTCKSAVLTALQQSLVEKAGERRVAYVAEAVVGLDILLECLAAVEANKVSKLHDT